MGVRLVEPKSDKDDLERARKTARNRELTALVRTWADDSLGAADRKAAEQQLVARRMRTWTRFAAVRMGGDLSKADDVAQDIYLRLQRWVNRGNALEATNYLAYEQRIMKSALIDHIRPQRRWDQIPRRTTEGDTPVDSKTEEIERTLADTRVEDTGTVLAREQRKRWMFAVLRDRVTALNRCAFLLVTFGPAALDRRDLESLAEERACDPSAFIERIALVRRPDLPMSNAEAVAVLYGEGPPTGTDARDALYAAVYRAKRSLKAAASDLAEEHTP